MRNLRVLHHTNEVLFDEIEGEIQHLIKWRKLTMLFHVWGTVGIILVDTYYIFFVDSSFALLGPLLVFAYGFLCLGLLTRLSRAILQKTLRQIDVAFAKDPLEFS